jgi:hypothetical protein
MESSMKIVTRLPLDELWTDGGAVQGTRSEGVGEDEIRMMLAQGPVQFVEANIGHRLRWVPLTDRFRYWKNDVRPRLVPS